ncbi:ABC transporter ATP-binding protein [Iamia sp. SCSIO 61187]|uniref:ABC transporter ATP-binding protein n=1 Tax=Iamia sp. SCSIO 61187 TaxID=2722752 RepID=UPI002107FD0E|nr:ABC transporter ATP-binding protein [Iamia sp. SCSIO 61187]
MTTLDKAPPPADDGDGPDDDVAYRPPAGETRGIGGGRMGAIGMPVEKTEDFRGTLQRLSDRLRTERGNVVAVVVLSVVSVALMSLGPRVLGRGTNVVVDGILSGAGVDWDRLRGILLLALGLYLTSAAMTYLQGYLLAGIVQRSMERLRDDVEDKINRLPLAHLDKQSRGDVLSRVTNDIDNLAQGLQQTLSQILNSSLHIVGVVIMMFTISWPLALVALVTIPVSLRLLKAITNRSKKRFIAQWTHTGALNGQVEEAFTGHTLMKVYGLRAATEERFDAKNQELFDAADEAQFLSGTVQPAMMFLGNLNYVIIAVLGGLQVSSGRMSIGDIQAFIQYSRQFTQPLTQLASMVSVFQSSVASAERVFTMLDWPDQSPDPVDATAPTSVRGRVEFDHVHFSYDPDRPLIQDLSLVAEPGQTVAIVGPTGAGKTTLVNLIMRFYELDEGQIRLDGQDIATMRRADLRAQIGMVLQDTWLFEGTIRENIAFGNLEATDDQIREAARATYVDRFVHSMPEGYDTVLDDEGTSVSAGEKQLLTIARAFLADPAILILDEATSSVDTRTEVLIQEAMSALRTNRTSFVIAHRLSTIRDADTILVMDGGRIAGQGHHDDLLARGGAYADLYNAQFAGHAT